MAIYEDRHITIRHVLKDILMIILCSMIIALVFMLVTSSVMTLKIYSEYFVISICIGLSIGLPTTWAFYVINPQKSSSRLLLLIACVLFGAYLGSFLAGRIFVLEKFAAYQGQVPPKMLIVAIIIGFAVSFFFVIYEKYIAFKLSANEEKLKRSALEKEKLNADLKLLQAQVEPHFLFNTLSNILSLLEHEPKTGKEMLENLTQYLRTSLIQSRKPVNRLADEIKMIQTYLDIYKIRMDKRLSYEMDIPENVLNQKIPPMILQPLVENAIKHGLEPKIQGGKITIRARKNDDMLILEISDTGMGIKEKSAAGVGTGNIQKRLAALFGDRATLSFEDMTPEGLKIIVEIPSETGHSHHR